MPNRLVSAYLAAIEDRLSRPTMSLSQLAMFTAFLCVFVVPAVMALSMIIASPFEGLLP